MRWCRESIGRVGARALFALALAGGACTMQAGAPPVAAQPTWADVEPIVDGECSSCHGSTADADGLGYRLDFFDMTQDTCGDAAAALGDAPLAGAWSMKIGQDVTPSVDGHAKMPPLPGTPLADWERETLQRWASQPVKGPPPAGNHAPFIQVSQMPSTVDKELDFTAVLDDADGDSVVGAIEIADVRYLMNRSGSFGVAIDSSGWPTGTQRMKAVLCDGWQSVTVDLGPIQISH
jgi:hypothetical protein